MQFQLQPLIQLRLVTLQVAPLQAQLPLQFHPAPL